MACKHPALDLAGDCEQLSVSPLGQWLWDTACAIRGATDAPEFDGSVLPADGTLGEFVTGCLQTIARMDPELQGVLHVKGFNERLASQRALDEQRLAEVLATLGLTGEEAA